MNLIGLTPKSAYDINTNAVLCMVAFIDVDGGEEERQMRVRAGYDAYCKLEFDNDPSNIDNVVPFPLELGLAINQVAADLEDFGPYGEGALDSPEDAELYDAKLLEMGDLLVQAARDVNRVTNAVNA